MGGTKIGSMNLVEVKTKNRRVKVAGIPIDDKIVVSTGRWIRIARVFGESWLPGQVLDDPEPFIRKIKESDIKSDVFTFAQKIPAIKPKYGYFMDWDNAAAIPITKYDDWLSGLSSDARRDLKRAGKKGIVTKSVELSDEIIMGIMEIHNESFIRQGGVFSHYGEDFETVKRGYSTYSDRSEFLAAFDQKELVGLIKLVYVGDIACMMQLITKAAHHDKSPANALIAKAVEICENKGKSYLTFGNYYYGNKKKSSLIDFKHRCGFIKILYPRYYIPLNIKGRFIISLRLHRGLLAVLPAGLISFLLYLRTFINTRIRNRSRSSYKNQTPDNNVQA